MIDKRSYREEMFAREYVVDLNGSRAATAAGYSEHTAAVTASKLLTKPKVKKMVSDLMAKRASKLELKAEHVVEELRKIAFSNMLDYTRVDEDGQLDVDLSALTREQAAAIQEVTVDTTGGSGDGERRKVLRTKFKLGDKRGSLELLGQHIKMFTDKLEISGGITTVSDDDLTTRLAKLVGK